MDVVSFQFPTEELVAEFVVEVTERYGFGTLQKWGIFEGGSSGSIWLRASNLSFVVRFTTESRTKDRFLLEHKVVEVLGDAGIPVSRIKSAKDGSIVHPTDLFGWETEYAVYEILEGDIYRFDDITNELLEKAVKTIALLHETLGQSSVSTDITSSVYLHVVLEEALERDLQLLLSQNFQSRSPDDIEFIARWWNANRLELEALTSSFTKNPQQIIHGDLNPSNFVLTGSTYGLIDFERVGLAPVEWDIGYALGAWISDQRVMSTTDCYHYFRALYQKYRPSFVWNDSDMLSLLKAFYFSHIYAGIIEPRKGELEGSLHNRTAIYTEGMRGLVAFEKEYAEIITSY